MQNSNSTDTIPSWEIQDGNLSEIVPDDPRILAKSYMMYKVGKFQLLISAD